MMRSSDLVRGKLPTPAGAGRVDGTRLSDLPELVHDDAKTSQSLSPTNPPEQQDLPIPGNHFTPRNKNIYLNAQNYLQEVKGNLLLKGKPPSPEKPQGMIERILAEPSMFDELYQLTLVNGNGYDPKINSSVNNMIYCLKIGVRMGYTPFRLTELCMSALHHDVGMFLIPEEIIGKEGHLTESEWDIIKKHTATGRDLLKSFDPTYPNLGRAIYEHHERESGQGYLHGIKGDEISEYAKIIGICDSYEAMTHNRPHRKAVEQYISVLELAKSKDLFFAPHIMKIFLDEITLYPIGSYVRLNNKAIGVVVQTNKNNPFKPTVRLMVDGQGNRMVEEKLYNLTETAILNIVTGVKANDVSEFA